MLAITERLTIPDDDLEVRFARSGGPGGQHVNKVSTKVELRFHMERSKALPRAVKRRLAESFPGHVSDDGEVLVASSRYRSQTRNRQDAEERLAEMIRSVLQPPKPRRPTTPSKAAKRRRTDEKRRRGQTKRRRRRPLLED